MTTSPEGGWAIDDDRPAPQPRRARCHRCGTTRRPGWHRWRHRLFTCHPERLAMRARVLRPLDDLWPGEEGF